MQSRYPKIFFCILLTIVCCAKESSGQAVNENLGTADALFTQKKYTESFNLYQEVFDQGLASPQMLLKMAFIKEGLEEYPEALFYLTEYYYLTHSRQVLDKIKEIAARENLVGYEITDSDHFIAWYQVYYERILIGLMAVLFVLFLLQTWKYWRVREISAAVSLWQLVFAVLLVLMVNFSLAPREAIIFESSTYLMKGPSAGAPMMEVVSNGHKVKILDEGEVWTKIQWKNAEVYVRSSSIRRLG